VAANLAIDYLRKARTRGIVLCSDPPPKEGARMAPSAEEVIDAKQRMVRWRQPPKNYPLNAGGPCCSIDWKARRMRKSPEPLESQHLFVCLEQLPKGRRIDYHKLTASIAFDDNASLLDTSNHSAAVAAKVPVE
jgi:DNA-directed RNA polymerase specialized sigma24 family protein